MPLRPANAMWFTKKADVARDVMIRARLESGEMLHITFSDDREPRDLQIEGSGEIRLSIRDHSDFRAEVVRKDSVELQPKA